MLRSRIGLQIDGSARRQAAQRIARRKRLRILNRHELHGVQLGMQLDRLGRERQIVTGRQALLLRTVFRKGLHVQTE